MIVSLGGDRGDLISKADVRGKATGDLDIVLEVTAQNGLANASD